ncbi:MAG: glycosyltransferase family 4 protein [Bacteroidales bacterium]|nr:glycosyltransferase family 4 protein [Bacteroidales bacterium]
MKTLWIINEYAGSPYHGMEFRHYYLAKELLKYNYNVYIITASFSHLYKTLPKVKNRFTIENIDGIKYVWIKVPKYSSSRSKKRVLKWFVYTFSLFLLQFKKLPKPHYILLSPMQTMPILPSLYFKRKFKAKLIFEVKDIWPLSIIELGNYSEKNLFIRILKFCEKLSLKKSDLIISVLPNYGEYLRDEGINREYVYLPNGINVEDFNQPEPLDFDIKSLIGENTCIAYTGTIGLANALEHFVQAAKILSDKKILFLIVGNGDFKQEIEKLAKGYSNIKFLPPVKKKQIPTLLSFVDACYIGLRKCNLFKYGISPNKLFDYMMAGKPIVFAINTKNSIVEQANCGVVVEPENYIDIANGIMKVCNLSESEKEELKNRSVNFILNYHTYEKIANNFVKILEE